MEKPIIETPVKSVINFKSGFAHKLLCDGLTFSLNTSCHFSCKFCYVPNLMFRQPIMRRVEQDGYKFQDVEIRRENALDIMFKQLTDSMGNPKFKRDNKGWFDDHPIDNRVIYASPLCDVAATAWHVKQTVAACKMILELTDWSIRLLSKSSNLVDVAEAVGNKERMIYGISTGSTEPVASAIEIGASPYKERIQAIHHLQDSGCRTFSMLCPSLPQDDYDNFSKEMTKAVRVGKSEHVWCECLNARGKSMVNTIEALNIAGCNFYAEKLREVQNPIKWEKYSRETFLAHTRYVPKSKLRFLQYVNGNTRDWWTKWKSAGAILLGGNGTNPNAA